MSFPQSVRIRPATALLDADVAIPGSKSLTNRVLPLAAFAHGESYLRGVLFSEDTQAMLECLRRLGVRLHADERACTVRVGGSAGHLRVEDADLDCQLSGTTLRFLAGMLATQVGRYRLDGVPRMRERPVGDLCALLAELGCGVSYELNPGFPPVVLDAEGLAGGEVAFDSPPSSQLVSGLLMAAPLARHDVLIRVDGEIVSRPYIDMTIHMMRDFGVEVVEHGGNGQVAAESRHAKMQKSASTAFIVPAPQAYLGQFYEIEPDASNASYFLAAAAAVGGRVTVHGLGSASVQGDARFCDVLRLMGCTVEQTATTTTVRRYPDQPLTGIDVDLNGMPDMAQTLAAIAILARNPTTVRNVANLAVKETDRLAAVATEAAKFGAQVELRDDGWTIHPPAQPQPAEVATYNDHRMAMAFAVTGLCVPGTVINDPKCVAKTFPDFFERFAKMSE